MALPQLGRVKHGARQATHADAAWAPLACALHSGQAVIALEQRTDPATGEPRVVQVKNPVTGETATQIAEFPIYSDDTGHDPDCPTCAEAVLAMRLHMRAVEADHEQADFEFQRELRRRGMAG